MITKKYASNHNQFTNYNKIHKPKHTLHAYRKHQPVPSTQALKTNTQLLSSSRTLPQLLNLPKTNLSNLLLIKMMKIATLSMIGKWIFLIFKLFWKFFQFFSKFSLFLILSIYCQNFGFCHFL